MLNAPIFFRTSLSPSSELGKRNFTRHAAVIAWVKPAHFGKKRASVAKRLSNRQEDGLDFKQNLNVISNHAISTIR